LKQKGIKFFQIGRETKIDDIFFINHLNKDSSKTASFIRYFPDFLLISKRLFFAEIKNSSTIEKEAYDFYLHLEKEGCEIMIFFLLNESFRFCKPSEIPFIKYPTVNGLMRHFKAGVWVPSDGIWSHPREMSQEDLKKFNDKMKSSGTSFAHICTNTLRTFKAL